MTDAQQTTTTTSTTQHASPPPWLTHLLDESKVHGLSYVDVAPFLRSTFDPQEYANAIIDAPSVHQEQQQQGQQVQRDNGRSSAVGDGATALVTENWLPQSGRVEGDLSVALGRLNLAIDDVDRLVRDEVTKNASSLLAHTSSLLDLRPTLVTLNESLDALESHQAKLVARISVPRQTLYACTMRLASIRSAQSLIKRTQRLVRLLRRLQSQMHSLADRRGGDEKSRLDRLGEEDGEEDGAVVAVGVDEIMDEELDEHGGRGLSRAALTVAEITSMLRQDGGSRQAGEGDVGKQQPSSSLLTLTFVQDCLPFVEEARERVTDLMESMVVRGLRDLSPTLLSTSLQTAFNLGQLTDLVRDLLADLTDVVRDRVHAAFDMQMLAKELGSKEPQTQHSTTYRARRGEYSSALHQRWTTSIWSKFDTLLVGEMGAVCSKVYTLERVLSLKTDPSARTSYLEQAMSVLGDRPSAMFWSTLADAMNQEVRVCSSSFLLQTLELGYPRLLGIFQDFYAKVSVYTGTSYTHVHQSPETLVILRSLARFEDSFLAKSSLRFEQSLSTSFNQRQVPGAKEATALARLALGELDAARIDPLLLHAVSKNVCEWLTKAVRRIEELVVHDKTTKTLQSLSPSHLQNASLTVASYHLSLGLRRAIEQGPVEAKDRLKALDDQLCDIQERLLVEPLLHLVCKEISDIMSRLHYVDFSLDRDAVSGSGSAYMVDLSERIWFLREKLFVHYDVPTADWLIRIGKHALRAFVVHASLIRPLGEGGKLKLTSDMTELEFSVSQLLASAHHANAPLSMTDCGDEFTLLRHFRHLLFSNVLDWKPTDALQVGLSPLVASHHVLARSSSLPMPHELHQWTKVEYVRWLDRHSTLDGMQLVRGCVEAWQARNKEEPRPVGDPQDENKSKADDKLLVACLERIIAFSATTNA